MLAGILRARFSHTEPAVLVGAEELAARGEAFAAWQVYAAHQAADHVLGHGFIAGRRRSGGILSAGIAAEPLEQSIDNQCQRDEKQEFGQGGVRGRVAATFIITQACRGEPDSRPPEESIGNRERCSQAPHMVLQLGRGQVQRLGRPRSASSAQAGLERAKRRASASLTTTTAP